MGVIKLVMDKILTFIIVAYLISVGVFGIYYNYLYANEHGFLAWVFFGEIVASLKALVWPLFEFNIL